MVTCNTGVGKTTFMNFALVRWLRNPKIKEILLQMTGCQDAWHIVRSDSTGAEGQTFKVYRVPAERISRALAGMYKRQGQRGQGGSGTCIYACDTETATGHPLQYQGFTVVTASPNRSHYADLLKERMGSVFYAQLWSLESLHAALRLFHMAKRGELGCAVQSEAELTARFQRLHGVFRHVMTNRLEHWLQLQHAALDEITVEAIGQISSDLKVAGEVAHHRLFVLQPWGFKPNGDPDSDHSALIGTLGAYETDFVSKDVMQAFDEKVDELPLEDVERYILRGPTRTARVRGSLWERAVLRQLRGGDSMLTTALSYDGKPFTGAPTQVSHRACVGAHEPLLHEFVTETWRIQQVAELPSVWPQNRQWEPRENLLLIPLSETHPMCDAFFFQMAHTDHGKEPVIWLLQATIAASHPITGWDTIQAFLSLIRPSSAWCPEWMRRMPHAGSTSPPPKVKLAFVTPNAATHYYKREQKYGGSADDKRNFLRYVSQCVLGCKEVSGSGRTPDGHSPSREEALGSVPGVSAQALSPGSQQGTPKRERSQSATQMQRSQSKRNRRKRQRNNSV